VATVHPLHAGYNRGDNVGSSVTLVRDGEALIVCDPGLVASRSLILDPLAALGVGADDVSHVFLSHHHPDHTLNAGLFQNAWFVDCWARYKGDVWLDHSGDGWKISDHATLWLTPGHSNEDATLIVDAEEGVWAMTHLWWLSDRTPEIDPYAPDQERLALHRARVLEVADFVIPGHGEPFRVER
jgi:glyoxylase-like metal-dependent hydrolase (beta-lactamase superfamily II)